MPHDIALIATVAMGFVLAFPLGFLASRIGLPPLVGYLLAGIAMGPHTPGFVADSGIAGQLAEIGVMLLMFGVGLHFSVADLLAVRRIAIAGAVGQIVLATAIGAGMAMTWGWSFGGGLVLGLCLSVASTVVLLKALDERNAVSTPNGRIAVGWLIVEDLAMVLTLVLLPAFAQTLGGVVPSGDHGHGGGGHDRALWLTLVITLGKVTAFVATALILGPRVVPWLLKQAARTGSRELFTLSVLFAALGIAYASAELFGVSFALGAFFAGVILNESELSHKAAANSLPLQDAFAVLFFISVGMLFDPSVLMKEPLMVASVVLLIIVGKSLVALSIVLLLRFPFSTALTVSAALAQIGEFSFILAGLGLSYQLLPADGFNLILAGALFSITFNPLVFAASDRICGFVRSRPGLKARLEDSRLGRFNLLRQDLEHAREVAEKKAAAHQTFSPEELAQRFPLFADLTGEQREFLLLHFETREAQPGDRIIRKGDEADLVYFIASGEVEVAVANSRFKLKPGDYFGEMALITGKPRSADVTALNYCRFAVLDVRDFRKFLRRFPQIRERVDALAAERDEINRQALDRAAQEDNAEESAPPPPVG